LVDNHAPTFSREFDIPLGVRREHALQALRETLREAADEPRVELWIRHDKYRALRLLLSDDTGLLAHMRYEGDAGFTSRNPAYGGDPSALLDFTLANGQGDQFPAAWCYPRRDLFAAVQHFAETGRMPETIAWHNDSGDGATSPNDSGWVMHDPNAHLSAHKRSSGHREELERSERCGCFYCLEVYRPSAIEEWVDEEQTAICPRCGIDAVVGSDSGYSIDRKFLQLMHDHWFR
jgi:hypothetical protein